MVYVTLREINSDFGIDARRIVRESKSRKLLKTAKKLFNLNSSALQISMCRTSRMPSKVLLNPMKPDIVYLKSITYELKFGEAKSSKFGSFQMRKNRKLSFQIWN